MTKWGLTVLCTVSVGIVCAAEPINWPDRLEIAASQVTKSGDYEGAVASLKALLKETDQFAAHDIRRGLVLHDLGVALAEFGAYAEAERYFVRATETYDERDPLSRKLMAIVLNDSTTMYIDTGQTSKAERTSARLSALLANAHEPDEVARAAALNGRARIALVRGKLRESEQLLLGGLEQSERTLGRDHLTVACLLYSLGELKIRMGHPAEAVEAFERSLAIVCLHFPPEHPSRAKTLLSLAVACHRNGDFAHSEASSGQALQNLELRLAPNHPAIGIALSIRAEALRKLKRGAEARKLEKRARAIFPQGLGDSLRAHTVDISTLAGQPRRARP